MSALPALRAEIDATDALTAHIRKALARITANHRIAREELREGMAAINRVNKQMPRKIQYVRDISLSFEQPPIPLRQFDWRAMHHGDDEEPSRHGWGRTPEEALADLKRVDADFADSLQTEEQRLLEEQP
jgi:hypothetical protein